MNRPAPCVLASRLGLAAIGILFGMPLLVWFSWLRETPSFWTNAGGYPIWLRELVLVAYYPLFLASVAGTVLYIRLLVFRPPQTRVMRSLEFAVLNLMVVGLVVSIAIDLIELR